MKRQVRASVLATVVAAGLLVVPTVPVSASPSVGTSVVSTAPSASLAAAANPCTPNSDEVQTEGVGPRKPLLKVCIAGNTMPFLRGRIERACLVAVKVPADYFNSECSGGTASKGAEYIAQARAIAKFNRTLPDAGAGVSPNLQWELSPRKLKRIDIFYYDRKDDTKQIQLYEAKVNVNGDAAAALAQLDGYRTDVQAVTGRPAIRGTFLGAYNDYFRIKAPDCPGDPSPQFHEYHVSVPEAGLLWVQETQSVCTNTRPAPRPRGDEVEDDEKLPIKTPVPYEEPDYAVPGDLTGQPIPVPEPKLPAGVVASRPCSWWVCVSGEGVDIQWDDVWSGISDGGEVTKHWLEDASTALNDFEDKILFGSAYGDPHYLTLDGLHYDLQAAGEFVLAQSPSLNMKIQTRLVPLASNVSRSERIALDLNGFPIEIAADGKILVDGETETLENGVTLYTGNGSGLVRSDFGDRPSYSAIWPGQGPRPLLRYVPSLERVQLWVPKGASDVSGLLGDADGQSRNDLKFRDGTQLPFNAPASTIHGSFADSWRITNEESLFTYEAGKSTASFTDRAFPEEITTVADLAEADVVTAASECRGAGVGEGPQFDDCILDVVLTSSTVFAETAASIVRPSIDNHDATLDAGGEMAWNFEGDIPRNVSPIRVSSDAGATRFAGPFGNSETYGFAVPEIPNHDKFTVSFDVLAIGDWNSDSDSERLSLKLNGTERWSATQAELGTPVKAGTLSNGSSFAAYRVSVQVEHLAPQLQAVFSATNVNSLAQQGFGIDEVTVKASLQPPDIFSVALPLTVSDGIVNAVATAKAGKLETQVSEDVYNFALDSQGSLLLDFTACPSTGMMFWSLVNQSTGATVRSGVCAAEQIESLPAGNYQFKASSGALHGMGTYKVNIQKVAKPQIFQVTLPLSASNGVVNGVSTSGAGNLETKASQDEYRFTVPAGGQTLTVSPSACPGPASIFLRWKMIDDTSDATLHEGGCFTTSLGRVEAGTYRLVVAPELLQSGTYALTLQPAQSFAASLPLTVTSGTINGTAVTGAGNLETKASEDVYRFTVPSGGMNLSVAPGSCPSLGMDVEIVNDDTEASYFSSSSCDFASLGLVPAGNYRLHTRASSNAGTYTLTVQPPQEFATALPLAVQNGSINGAAAVGAGNLEVKASEDVYRFTVPDGGLDLTVAAASCPTFGLDWRLIEDASGKVVGNAGDCEPGNLGHVAAGSYQLVAHTSAGYIGTYTLSVDSPQTFSAAVPLTIASGMVNGASLPGAGNLEWRASTDIYRFEVPAGGTSLSAGGSNCPLGGLAWTITNEDSDATIVTANDCSFTAVGTLAAGRYRLTISPAGGYTGTYSFSLQSPQTFTASLPLSISNGVVNDLAQPGAGNLESRASQDVYRFTVPNPGVALSAGGSSCPTLGPIWSITNLDTGAQIKSADSCAFTSLGTLNAGNYQLTLSAYAGFTGTYKFLLQLPQTFTASLPLSIAPGTINGAVQGGAGNLESPAAQDVYQFQVPAGGKDLAVGGNSCPGLGPVITVTKTTGETIKSINGCAFSELGKLSEGSYRLTVQPYLGYVGTYSLSILESQVFSSVLPLDVSNGKINGNSVIGSGNLEARASRDIYEFNLASGTQSFTITPGTCPSGYLSWSLLLKGSTTPTKTGTCSASTITNLGAGTYQLIVQPQSGYVGPYSLTATAG